MKLAVDLEEGIRAGAATDWMKVAEITADAFQNDPVNRWVMRKPTAIRTTFRVMARDIFAEQGFFHIAGDEGATMWLPPETIMDIPLRAKLALAGGLLGRGAWGALPRLLHIGGVLEENHPSTPHLYLSTVGVRPAAQGKGLGRKLLQPVLTAADQASLPVYLENSNPKNHGFYTSLRFQHVRYFDAGPGGPPLEAMWREPAA